MRGSQRNGWLLIGVHPKVIRHSGGTGLEIENNERQAHRHCWFGSQCLSKRRSKLDKLVEELSLKNWIIDVESEEAWLTASKFFRNPVQTVVTYDRLSFHSFTILHLTATNT